MTSYTHEQDFEASPAAVYAAITDIRSWWSGTVDGTTDRVGAEFRYRYPGMHDSTQRVTELVPNEKIVWHVTGANLTFVKRAEEWTGTDIVFELAPRGSGTHLRFTHRGLVPAFECYAGCSAGWDALLTKNLKARIASGQAQPDVFANG